MLHAEIEYQLANGSTGYIINDQEGIFSNWTAGQKYYISVDSVDGIDGSDIFFETHPIPNAQGERAGDVFRRGRSITLTGTIYADTLGAQAEGAEYLTEAFWDTDERKLLWYPLLNAPSRVYLLCRVFNSLSISRAKPTDRNVRWGWTVGLRAMNPIIYLAGTTTAYKSWMN